MDISARQRARESGEEAALQLLGLLSLKDKSALGDAMFCQRDLAGLLVGQGGDYRVYRRRAARSLRNSWRHVPTKPSNYWAVVA